MFHEGILLTHEIEDTSIHDFLVSKGDGDGNALRFDFQSCDASPHVSSDEWDAVNASLVDIGRINWLGQTYIRTSRVPLPRLAPQVDPQLDALQVHIF